MITQAQIMEIEIMYEQELQIKIRQLSIDLRKNVLDYVDFLISKYGSTKAKTTAKKFKFDWEGDLADLSKEYTSVELQHKALEWR